MYPTLEYTDNSLQILLKFSYYSKIISSNITLFSQITLQFYNYPDCNISIQQKANKASFLITLKTNVSIIGHPTLNYSFIVAPDVLLLENLVVTSNSAQINLKDYHILSQNDQNAIESTKSQTKATSYLATASVYVSNAAASGTPTLLKGMMLIELIYLIKYVNINYPPNVLEIFQNQNKMTMFFNHPFKIWQVDENKLPENYIAYGVSPYFLDNAGDIICQVLLVLTIVVLLTIIVEKWQGRNIIFRIISLIHSLAVWEIVLFFLILYTQKFVFFICSGLVFNSEATENGKLNLGFTVIFLIFQCLFLAHLFIIMKILQSFKPKLTSGLKKIKDNNNISNLPIGSLLEEKELDASNQAVSVNLDIKQDNIQENEASEGSSRRSPLFNENKVKPMIINYEEPEEESKIEETPHNNEKSLAVYLRKLRNCFINLNVVQYLYFPKNQEKFLGQYEFLHLDLRSEKIWQRYFVLFDYLRQIILSILAVIFYFSAFSQILLINLLNILFIFYYILAFPFKSKLLFFLSLISEIITECALLSALGLAILDRNADYDEYKRMKLGWVIVSANLALLYWLIILGMARIIIVILEKRNRMKIAKSG